MTFKSKPIYERNEDYIGASRGLGWAAFSCNNCGTLSIGAVGVGGSSYSDPNDEDIANEFKSSDNTWWLPESPIGKAFPDVPEQIAQAADEAYRCLSANLFRGAVILARAVIEATCKDQGATGRNLQIRIDALKDSDLIRPGTADLAHEIRHFGNDMAHGDFIVRVDKEDCEETLTLMSEVLNEVYQNPARLAKAKAARTARKEAGDAS